jgi:hypothetical protein
MERGEQERERGREGEGERGGEGNLADGLFLQYCSIFRNVLKTF